MRWILKIALFPISLLLSILTAFLTFLLDIGTTILYVLFVDNTGRIYSLCNLIDIICSVGKQAL